jgi:hypothetical protein
MASGLIICPKCGNVTQPNYCPSCNQISRRRRLVALRTASIVSAVFAAGALTWLLIHIVGIDGGGSRDGTTENQQITGAPHPDQASDAAAARQRVQNAVRRLQDQGIITEINVAERTARVNESIWIESELKSKQKLVNLLSLYVQGQTGAYSMTILSDRNDQKLGERGILGDVTIYE